MLRSKSRPDLHDSDLHVLYMVVGYHDIPSSTYKETRIFGTYTSLLEANRRVMEVTGDESMTNFRSGKNFSCWINKVPFGDCNRLPNAGAYDVLNTYSSFHYEE